MSYTYFVHVGSFEPFYVLRGIPAGLDSSLVICACIGLLERTGEELVVSAMDKVHLFVKVVRLDERHDRVGRVTFNGIRFDGFGCTILRLARTKA